jgi:hypothetical protein
LPPQRRPLHVVFLCARNLQAKANYRCNNLRSFPTGAKSFIFCSGSVWLEVEWVGLDPTQFLRTEPTRLVFGCTSAFRDGANPTLPSSNQTATGTGSLRPDSPRSPTKHTVYSHVPEYTHSPLHYQQQSNVQNMTP